MILHSDTLNEVKKKKRTYSLHLFPWLLNNLFLILSTSHHALCPRGGVSSVKLARKRCQCLTGGLAMPSLAFVELNWLSEK